MKTQAQKRELRHYLGGLWGESERKNLTQISDNAVGVEYNPLHHFMTDAPWSYQEINERRLKIITQCRQTKIAGVFSLIIDDSGHRKSGNFTDGVGRQYIGEVGKTENGNVLVTTHIDDGIRSFPLDVELYYKAENFEKGEEEPSFQKKPEVEIDKLSGEKTIAIVMNASSFNSATEIDYLITNEGEEKATAEWIVNKYSQRNWIEVFYREVKGWLG